MTYPVRSWMTWILALLIAFPGCICTTLCLGDDHEHAAPGIEQITDAHYCAGHHHHHHGCPHCDREKDATFSQENQSESIKRPQVSQSQVTELAECPQWTLPPRSHRIVEGPPKFRGRLTLIRLQRFLI